MDRSAVIGLNRSLETAGRHEFKPRYLNRLFLSQPVEPTLGRLAFLFFLKIPCGIPGRPSSWILRCTCWPMGYGPLGQFGSSHELTSCGPGVLGRPVLLSVSILVVRFQLLRGSISGGHVFRRGLRLVFPLSKGASNASGISVSIEANWQCHACGQLTDKHSSPLVPRLFQTQTQIPTPLSIEPFCARSRRKETLHVIVLILLLPGLFLDHPAEPPPNPVVFTLQSPSSPSTRYGSPCSLTFPLSPGTSAVRRLAESTKDSTPTTLKCQD